MDPQRRFTLQASGPQFRPRQSALKFSQSVEPGSIATFGGTFGQVASVGSALYVVPADLKYEPQQSHFAAVLTHLSELLTPLRAAGATRFVLHMHRTFDNACNEEFTREENRMLASLGCDFFYVARNDG